MPRHEAQPGFWEELFELLKARVMYWVVPVIIVILVFAGMILLAQSPAVAPVV